MKKLAIVLVVVMALALSVSAENGATTMKPVLYVGGGVGMPIGPEVFSDAWKMGIGFGGGIGLQATPTIEVVGKVFYNTFPMDLPDIEGVTTDGGDLKFLEFGADVKYLFTMGPDSPFGPFLLFGTGLTNIKISDFTASGADTTITVPLGDFSETKFALAIGGGFDYMFSPKAGIWVEGRYAMVLTEGDSFSYFPIRAGLKVLFGE